MTLLLALAVSAQDLKPENRPENLKAHFAAIQKAIREGDARTSLALTKSLLCDEARLRKALKEDVDKDVLAKLAETHKGYASGPDEKVALAFKSKPEQTEIQVHGATVEEIARGAKDSVAAREFPGGAEELASTILKPGTTFYEVEFLEPGQEQGIKFHLFFWDGERWAMLGAAWRALRK
jgi:hypothetical protein